MSSIRETAELALKALHDLGAQSASAQAINGKKSEFTIEGGRFTLLRTTLDNSLSLQAIKDFRRGGVSGNSFEQEAVLLAARDCVASAEAAQPDPAWEMAKEGQGQFRDGALEPDMEELFFRTRELMDSVHREYPKIILEQVITAHTARSGVYLNSFGVEYSVIAGQYEVTLMFSGHDGDQSSSFNYCGILTDSLDKPFIDLGSIRQNLSDAENQIHTQQTQGKFEGTVIFTPDCLGSMLSELLDNYVADGVLLDGTSQWKDNLGKQVADKRITLSLKPLDPRVICGERYTAEGFASQDYDIISSGVLQGFMLSKYAANKTGKKRAPNASGSMVMAPGGTPLSDIIKHTKKGLLVSRYSGGAAGTNGEFSGVAKNSFLIQDGKIGPAVSETMISGNLAGMLNRVAGISRETVDDGMTSLPWLAVEGIMISGK